MELVTLRLSVIDHSIEILKTEKGNLLAFQTTLTHLTKKMEHHLRDLTGVEHQLYYEIVVNGLNANKAVEKVSLHYDMSVSSLWKTYYPSVKEKLKELKEKENLDPIS